MSQDRMYLAQRSPALSAVSPAQERNSNAYCGQLGNKMSSKSHVFLNYMNSQSFSSLLLIGKGTEKYFFTVKNNSVKTIIISNQYFDLILGIP